MTKKIRLMDEETKTEPGVVNADAPVDGAVADDVYKKQLMKYLEAIDWKLWEMLKLMRAEDEEKESK
tara:strand:+ start:1468 stop:1668 length:201 start_codon:yes stop_codon:yes gene_type:complete